MLQNESTVCNIYVEKEIYMFSTTCEPKPLVFRVPPLWNVLADGQSGSWECDLSKDIHRLCDAKLSDHFSPFTPRYQHCVELLQGMFCRTCHEIASSPEIRISKQVRIVAEFCELLVKFNRSQLQSSSQFLNFVQGQYLQNLCILAAQSASFAPKTTHEVSIWTSGTSNLNLIIRFMKHHEAMNRKKMWMTVIKLMTNSKKKQHSKSPFQVALSSLNQGHWGNLNGKWQSEKMFGAVIWVLKWKLNSTKTKKTIILSG